MNQDVIVLFSYDLRRSLKIVRFLIYTYMIAHEETRGIFQNQLVCMNMFLGKFSPYLVQNNFC